MRKPRVQVVVDKKNLARFKLDKFEQWYAKFSLDNYGAVPSHAQAFIAGWRIAVIHSYLFPPPVTRRGEPYYPMPPLPCDEDSSGV
jgi:hypothetical protein